MSDRSRWLFVFLFAVAMAWMEAATVVYLRTLVNRLVPYQPDPLPVSVGLGMTELVREAATLIMLFAAGHLAGNTPRRRFGYFLIAFGVWDILYYVFLKLICGWPNSLLDWDILFLLPLPWWGPVLAPVIVAALMVIAGTLFTQVDPRNSSHVPGRRAWTANLCGMLLALYVFMADAIRALGEGSGAVRTVLPTTFNWPLFLVAVVLIAAPLVDLVARRAGRRNTATLDNH